ncbi:hypothetical protein DEA8626_01801 [Defluviimonas aquaemixtae]|uniref:Uncharacterized protein n=1 Tax=Albidovulum aquaemixtae TaxID=1542388 RepID=A0A2R8B6M9_9RHOB|nr:hypothetical protein [Defluviimonas aquaemixtae]SPH18269.1 hypothetical protein DEA8626_01801 [Defluviimonas aquaemixtae]
MTKSYEFVAEARAGLDQIDAELSALETKVKASGKAADDWTCDQAGKLRADWQKARTEMRKIADRIETEGDEAARDAKAQAERHWAALKAAVKAYRDHVG